VDEEASTVASGYPDVLVHVFKDKVAGLFGPWQTDSRQPPKLERCFNNFARDSTQNDPSIASHCVPCSFR
jgi:hypothetical protein